jgi:hypothetical protein
MRATTGKRGPAAVLAIGVPQQSVYQRKTFETKRKPVDGETPLATPLRGRTGTEA